MQRSSLALRASAAFLLTLSLTAGAAGCGGGGESSTGTLTIGVTDAAVDGAVAVVVEFSGIELQPAGGARLSYDFVPNRVIDLLALQGGARATLLDEETVPAGDYNWIRLAVVAQPGVTDSFIEFPGNVVASLRVPSGSTSGLQLSGGFTVAAGGVSDFTIDFDLRKSVHDPQGLPDYILRPSLRLVDNLVVGSVSGTVATGLVEDASCANDPVNGVGGAVYVFAGAGATVDDEGSATPPLTSAMVTFDDGSQTWVYTVAFLEPGDYTVAFTCEAANDAPDADDAIAFIGGPFDVTVVADADTPRDF
jgi:hypothetical protein